MAEAIVSKIHRHEKYERLVAAAQRLSPLPTAVAQPCDESSLRGAIEARDAGLITPILVGPKAKLASLMRLMSAFVRRLRKEKNTSHSIRNFETTPCYLV